MAKVTGIGGIFFKCQDPETMKNWFHKNLGLVINEYSSVYEFRSPENHKIELWEQPKNL